MKQKYLFTIMLVLYIVVLIYFAMTPNMEKNVPSIGYDKILHFFEFFVLAILLFKTIELYQIKCGVVLFFGSCLLIGIISELVQLMAPTRSFSMLDYMADIVGIIFAFIIYQLIKWK